MSEEVLALLCGLSAAGLALMGAGLHFTVDNLRSARAQAAAAEQREAHEAARAHDFAIEREAFELSAAVPPGDLTGQVRWGRDRVENWRAWTQVRRLRLRAQEG